MRNHYSIAQDFKPVTHGPVNLDEAFKIVDKYINYQDGLKGEAGYVISRSMFGFSINDCTFIELYIDDAHTYRMKFETLEAKKLLFISYQGLYQKEIKVPNVNSLKHIVAQFFNEDLADFKKYFQTL